MATGTAPAKDAFFKGTHDQPLQETIWVSDDSGLPQSVWLIFDVPVYVYKFSFVSATVTYENYWPTEYEYFASSSETCNEEERVTLVEETRPLSTPCTEVQVGLKLDSGLFPKLI
jgi:hypothetical protein